MSPPQFVKLFGYLFAFFFLLAVLLYYRSFYFSDFPPWLRHFIAANIVFYLVGTAALFSRHLLGFYLLKVFLYVLVLSFPIGTLIGIRILRYMRRRNIRFVFKGRG